MTIDRSKDKDYVFYNDLTRQFMEPDYLPNCSLHDRVTTICERAEFLTRKPGLAAALREDVRKSWISFSTPVWTNFGTDRGLPISCFGATCLDDTADIFRMHAEVGMCIKNGGGTAGYFGNLRERGADIRGGLNGQSSGSVHFAKMFDTLMTLMNQGSVRRGFFAGYWPITHKDIWEVLKIRSEGFFIQDMAYGLCIPEGWMPSMIAGDLEKRKVWAKVLEARQKTGYPYLIFLDNVAKNRPDVYKDLNLEILHSQMCTEIFLPTSDKWSFVCCLSSLNDLYYDDWKDSGVVERVVYLLDAVMTEFIEKASSIPFMENPVRFAREHRALGIGQLGWHSYLQSKMIPFDSWEAKQKNVQIAKTIRDQAYAASEKLGKQIGCPEMLRPYNRRHATLIAIAPTKSSAFIQAQASESIEAEPSNFYMKDLAKLKVMHRNIYLKKVLNQYGKNTEPVWRSILENFGSVQHLGFLTDHERKVFKTNIEIGPMEAVIQAAQRQPYIDQGQSLNLKINPMTPIKEVNAITIKAWELGLLSLYYNKSINAAQQFSRSLLTCSSCES